MEKWIEVDPLAERQQPLAEAARLHEEQLEGNQILFFPRLPFEFAEEDRSFLLELRRGDSAVHKNISYRPSTDELRGWSGDRSTHDRLQQALRNFSSRARAFVVDFLLDYAASMRVDFASFRPFEEAGRSLPLHKRNDLLHVDAFPTRPTRGGRILRFFVNIHPEKPRVWNIGEGFPSLARRYALEAGLQEFAAKRSGGLRRWFAFGRARYSAYDRFMLRFHDYMKENSAYQKEGEKIRVEFPPGSAWMVFSDGCPHAVLSGQSALEQAFIIPPSGLVLPEIAPIRVLESACGRLLA